jgi:hypothetical protein
MEAEVLKRRIHIAPPLAPSIRGPPTVSGVFLFREPRPSNTGPKPMTKPTKLEIVTANSAALPDVPDDLLEITKADARLGASDDPADRLLPLITVLQTNSPICDKRSPNHIAGAEPGNFWFRNDLIPIRDGLTGFICTPCGMQRVWLEWGPTRGSGLFGRHPQQPENVTMRPSEDGGRTVMARVDNGNVIVETREVYLIVDGKPYAFSAHGSAHTPMRQWQSLMDQITHPQTGKAMPTCAMRFQIATIARSNARGNWFIPKVDFRGFVQTRAEYDTAKQFAEIVKRGTYRVEMSGADAS